MTEVERLKAENEELREQVRQLKAVIEPDLPLPIEWPLTRTQQRVLRMLVARPVVTRRTIMAGLYSDRADGRGERVPDVVIHYLRRKLSPFGVAIETVPNRGWSLAPEWRESLAPTV